MLQGILEQSTKKFSKWSILQSGMKECNYSRTQLLDSLKDAWKQSINCGMSNTCQKIVLRNFGAQLPENTLREVYSDLESRNAIILEHEF